MGVNSPFFNSMKPKPKDCRNTDCDKKFIPFRSTDKYCSYNCQKQCLNQSKPKNRTITSLNRKKPIKAVSEIRKRENPIYTQKRKEFLSLPENKYCFIDGCKALATTIEHTRGRKGYFDDWARENKITLFIDVRFWKPCCLFHNLELERNPLLAKKYKLSSIHQGVKN